MELPTLVVQQRDRAAAAGFVLSCEPEVGRLLATLVSGVPPGGRVVELGSGAGVGTAWLAHGLRDRDDVQLVTVEADQVSFDLAATAAWPSLVERRLGDGLDLLEELGPGSADFVFADCPAGKHIGLERTIAALRPGGILVVDDMTPEPDWPIDLAPKQAAVRRALLEDPALEAAELAFSSGVVVAVRRHAPPPP